MLGDDDSSATVDSRTARILDEPNKEGSLPVPTVVTGGDISAGRTQEVDRFSREAETEALATAPPRAETTSAELRENGHDAESEGALVGGVAAGHRSEEDTRKQHPPALITVTGTACEEERVSMVSREATPDENTSTRTSVSELMETPQKVVPVGRGSQDDKRDDVSGEPPTARTPEEIPSTFTAMDTSGKGAMAPSDAAGAGGRETPPPEEDVTEKEVVPPPGQSPRRESVPGGGEISPPAVARNTERLFERGDVASMDKAEERGAVMEISNGGEDRAGDVLPSSLATLDDVLQPLADTDRPQKPVCTGLAAKSVGDEAGVGVVVADASRAESAMASPPVSVENRIATDYVTSFFASPTILELAKVAMSVEGTSTPEPSSGATRHLESNSSSNVLSAVEQGSDLAAAMSPPVQQPPESSHLHSALSSDGLRDEDVAMGNDQKGGSAGTNEPTDTPCSSVEIRVMENDSVPKQLDITDAATTTPPPRDESPAVECVEDPPSADAKHASSRSAALPGDESDDAAAARAQPPVNELGSVPLVVVPGLENHDDAGVSEGGVSSSKAIDVRVISDNPVAVEGRALVDEVILSCLVTAAAAVAATARAEIKPTGYASSVSASSLDKNARNSVRTPSSTGAKCQAEAEPSSPSSRSAGSARSVTLGSSVDDKRDTAGIEEGRSDRGSALSIEIAPTSVFPHAPTTVETRVVADYFDQIVPDILNKIVRETGTATTSTRDISSTSTSHLDNESRKSLRTPSSEGAISQTAGEPPRPSARPVGLSESVTLFDPSPVDDKGGDSTAKEGGNDGSDTVSIENTPTPVCSRVSTTIEARVVADYLNITVRNYLNQTVRDAALASTSTRDIASAHAGRLDNESTNCWRSSLSSKAVRCQADTEPPPQSAGPAVGPPITSMALCGSVEDKGSDSTVKAGSDARGGTLIVETTPTPVSSHAFTAVNGRVVADYLNQSFRDAATAVGQTTPGAVSGIATENTGAGSSTCQRKTPDCLPTSAISQDLNVPTDGGSTLSVEAGPTPAYPHDSTTLEARVVADYLNQTTRDVVMAESQSIPGAASRTTPQDTGAGSTCLPNRQNASPTASKDVNVFIFPEGEPPAVFSTTPTTVSVVAVHGLLGNAAESTENSPAMQTTDPNSINTRSNDRPSSSSSGSLEAAVAGDYLSEVSRRLATAEAEATKIVSPGVRNSLGELPGLVDDGQGLVSKADVVDGDRNMQPSSFVLVNDPVASPRTTSTAGSDKAVENFTSCEPLPVTEENSANAASLLASANNEKHSVAATPLSIPRSTVEIQDGPKRPCDEQPVGKSNLSLPPDTSGVEEGQTRGCISHRNSSPPSSASDRTAVVNEDISNRVGGVSLEEEGAVTASSASAEPGEPGSTPGKGSDMVVPELDVTGELVAVMSPENLAVVCADGDLDTVSGGSEPMHDGGNPLALNRATIDGCDGDKIRVDDDSIDVPVSSNSGDRDRKTPPESNENDEQSMAVDDADNILSPSPPVHLQTAVVADYLSGAFARLLHSETATTSEPAPCGVPSALIVSKHIRTPPLTSPTPPGTSQEGDKELERELDSSSPIGDDAAKTLSPRSGVEDALSWPQEEKSARVKIAQSSVEQIGGGEAAELTAMATAQPDRESEINSCEKEVKQPSPCRSVGALSELQQVEPRAQCQQEPPEGAEMAADTGACPAARGVEEFESAANKSNPIDDCGQAPHPSVETVPCLQAAGAAQVNCPQDYADGVSVDMGAGLAARGAEELERQTENRDLTEDTAPTPPCPSVEALPLKAEGHVESQQGGVAEVKENEVSGLAARGMAELERPRASEASSTGGLSRPSLQPELEVCSGSRAALTSPAVLATLGEEQATPAPHPTPNNDEMTAIYTPCPTGVLGKTADCIVTECPLPQGGNPALGRDDVPSCDRSPSADRTAPAPWIDPTTITNNTLRQRNSRHDTDHEVVPTAEPATDLRQMLEVGENEWARVSLSRTPPFDALNNPNPALRWAPVGHAGTGSIDAGGKSCASPPPHFPAVTSTAAAAESVDKGGAEVTGVCATQQPGGGGATAADGSLATINDNRGSEWGFFFAPPHRMAPTGDACGVDGFGSADASPGSTIRGDSTAGSDCFLSSSHVTTGNDGDERRGFRWSSTGDDDETASEESWGVLGKVQNPPDEARRRMMMRNNRGGACLVGEGGGGEVGGWKRAREGGMVESRTLASSGTVSLPKRNSRKRWNKAAERSRQYTRRWEVFLSQAGRYFEGEAQVRKRLSVICRAHPDVTNEIAFVALAQSRGRASEAAAVLHLPRAKDEAALVTMLLDVTSFINVARETAEERRRGARTKRQGIVEEEEEEGQQQQQRRWRRARHKRHLQHDQQRSQHPPQPHPHPRQQRHCLQQQSCCSSNNSGGNSQQQEEPSASRCYSQNQQRPQSRQGREKKRLRRREEAEEEKEDLSCSLDGKFRRLSGNDAGDHSYSRYGDDGGDGGTSEGDVIVEKFGVVSRRQQQRGIDGRGKGPRMKGEGDSGGGGGGGSPLGAREVLRRRSSGSAPALLPPLVGELTACDGTPPTPETLKTVLATSTSMAPDIPREFGLMPPETAVQRLGEGTRMPTRTHGSDTLNRGERPALRARARRERQRQKMAEMSAPGGGRKNHGSGVDALTQRAILEMCTLDHDSHCLDVRLQEPPRGAASLGGWREGGEGKRRRRESTSRRSTNSSSICLASLNNSSNNSSNNSNNIDALQGGGRDEGSCRVQSYFTQTLGDARRHAGAM